jgi:hypothetical protein
MQICRDCFVILFFLRSLFVTSMPPMRN